MPRIQIWKLPYFPGVMTTFQLFIQMLWFALAYTPVNPSLLNPHHPVFQVVEMRSSHLSVLYQVLNVKISFMASIGKLSLTNELYFVSDVLSSQQKLKNIAQWAFDMWHVLVRIF